MGIGRASADRHRDAKEREGPPWGRVGMASALKSIDDITKLVPPPANDGDGYRPSPDEPFMNPRQQDYFRDLLRSEEHTSELQSLMRISYAVFCLKKKKQHLNIEQNL